MHTVTTKAIVTADHTLTLLVPAEVSPGEHQVTLMIADETPSSPVKRSLMDWPAHEVALVDPTNTFRREDLYDDDCR